MGWFDQDEKQKSNAPAAAPRPAAKTAPAPSSPQRPSGGSSLGERVHINGTIVSEEDLTILGKVEGTIHARQTLVVAKGADLKAVIHGRKVLVDGTVKGDLNASEAVVLGPTASLDGNIATPSLQIREGAYFKGSVEMQAAKSDAPPAERSKAPDSPTSAKPGSQPADNADSLPAEGERPANKSAAAAS